MKQTAVEFLHSEYKKILYNVIVTPEQVMEMSDALAKANEMFEQQIIDAHINGQSEYDKGAYRKEVEENSEYYYNETFNK